MRAPPSPTRRSLTGLAALALALGLAAPARATDPSGACKEGAALCKEAFDRLDACEKKNPTAPDMCVGERAETENACKTTTSACHTDGSREPPAHTLPNMPKKQ